MYLAPTAVSSENSLCYMLLSRLYCEVYQNWNAVMYHLGPKIRWTGANVETFSNSLQHRTIFHCMLLIWVKREFIDEAAHSYKKNLKLLLPGLPWCPNLRGLHIYKVVAIYLCVVHFVEFFYTFCGHIDCVSTDWSEWQWIMELEKV